MIDHALPAQQREQNINLQPLTRPRLQKEVMDYAKRESISIIDWTYEYKWAKAIPWYTVKQWKMPIFKGLLNIKSNDAILKRSTCNTIKKYKSYNSLSDKQILFIQNMAYIAGIK